MFTIEEEKRKKWNHTFKSNCLLPYNRSHRQRVKSIGSTLESASVVYWSNWIYLKRKPNSFSLTASRRIFHQPWMEVNGSASFRPWVEDNSVHYFHLIEGVVSYERRLWPEKRSVWSKKKLWKREYRIMNIECRSKGYSVYFKKISRSRRLVGVVAPTPRRANPPFDIRYSIFCGSAVRF